MLVFERTAMNPAIALPLARGVAYISAYKPPITAVGAAANMPVKSRNTTKAPKLGATAHAIVKMVNSINVQIITGRLPRASLRLATGLARTSQPTADMYLRAK